MKTRTINKFAMMLTAFIAIAASLSSCSKKDDGKVEYLAFQESRDGLWGMISADGKVLFKDEFKKAPTVATDGRFFAKSKNGLWQMYEVNEKPKQIGGNYAHVSAFFDGRAIVAEAGRPVSIIDTEGKTVKLLDKIEGKTVEYVERLNGDYATFFTTDSLYGAIDKNGKCVIKPEYVMLNYYGDDIFIGIHSKYKKDAKNDKWGKVKVTILNADNKELFTFPADKYGEYGLLSKKTVSYSDNMFSYSIKKDGRDICGIIDTKGDEIVKATTKIKDISSIRGDKFTYSNGDGWGLMNTKGETIIRAKYDLLQYCDDGILAAATKDGDSYIWKIINENDEQIGEDTYVNITSFNLLKGHHAMVKPNDKTWAIIDEQGKQLEKLPDIADISLDQGEYIIESDYVDLEKFVSESGIGINGIFGMTFSSSAQSVVKKAVETGSAYGDKAHTAGTPYWYDYRNDVNIYNRFASVFTEIEVAFPGNLSRRTYRTERVIDYVWYDTYWYHDNQIPTGYAWSSSSPSKFTITVENGGRMHGKLRALYNLLVQKFKVGSKVEKQNDGAIVLTLSNGKTALLAIAKNKVIAIWGNIGSPSSLDISGYNGVGEDFDTEYQSSRAHDEVLGEYDIADSTDAAAADSASIWP